MKEHYYHNDARWKAAQKYRDEAEKAEAERILKQTFKELDSILDPVEDDSSFVDRGNR